MVKLRPIYIPRPEPDDEIEFDNEDTSLLLNEAFALHFAYATIASELLREGRIKTDYLLPNPEFLSELIYDLRNGELTGDGLISIFEMIVNAASGDKPFIE